MSPIAIRRLRKSLNLTQMQFAQLLGVHHLTIWKWEKGTLFPTPHQVEMLKSFKKARKNQPDVGEVVVGLLVGAGVAFALYKLLEAAFEDDE